MAHINIDTDSLSAICCDDVINELKNLIHSEMSKDIEEIDTEFVDECVDALLEIEHERDNSFATLVPLVTSDKFLARITSEKFKWKSLNRFTRIAIAAAILAGSTFTANAAVQLVTGVNVIETIADRIETKLGLTRLEETGSEDHDAGFEDDEVTETTTKPEETTTKPTTTRPVIDIGSEDHDAGFEDDETTTTEPLGSEDHDAGFEDDETTTRPTTTKRQIKPTTEVADVVPVITRPSQNEEEETTEAPVTYVGLYASFDNFKGDYIYNEEIDYENIVLKKLYSDGSQEDLSIFDCNYTKNIDMTVTQDVTIRIVYQNTLVTVDITIRPDEETRGSQVCSNDDFDYFLTDSGAYITAYKGRETKLDLSEIDGNPVYAISDDVFRDSSVEEIIAPDVKKIFKNAFRNCKMLVSCYTPAAVYIDDYAFEGCDMLSKPVFSEELTYFGRGVYMNSGIEDITIPSAITQVPNRICCNCQKLETVYLAQGTEIIDELAFSDCTSLLKVYNTDDIINVRAYAFMGDTEVDFSFPQGIENVGVAAFRHCHSLDIGALPQSIRSLSDEAFGYCYGITQITIPDGITVIPYGAFRGTNATEVIIPEGVEVIEDYALMGIKARELHLPSSITTLGDYAINSMMLMKIYFGENITSMGMEVIYPVRRLTVYVYEDTLPYEYAIDNNISYVLY